MEVKDTENRKYAAANRLARRRRKKIRVAVLLACVFILLIGILLILSCTVFFPISSVNVSGSSLYESSKIIDASEIEIGDKLFGISEKRVRENLTVKLPYIKDIQLKRNLFDSVEIIVTETSDAFCYQQNGRYYTADTDNKALAVFEAKPQGITEIIAAGLPDITVGHNIDIGADSLALVNNIYGILKKADINIDSLNISDPAAITATVEGRFSVNFGTLENIEQKTEHLRYMINEINSKNGTDTTGKINLSVWTSEKREGYFEVTGNF